MDFIDATNGETQRKTVTTTTKKSVIITTATASGYDISSNKSATTATAKNEHNKNDMW